jgi:hypothetical protein
MAHASVIAPGEHARVTRAGAPLLAGLVAGAATLVALHLLLLHTYWDYSEGVYALSSHLMLHGSALYSGMAGAQPPGVFVAGVALLALHDSVEWLRFAVACLQLVAGLSAAAIVLRVTGNRLATALTPAAMLLTPWAVHEHGALTPELVALPLMIGGALAAGDGPPPVAGVLCGLLPVVKYPFVLPAAAIVLLSREPRRTAAWAVGTMVLAFAVTLGLAGGDYVRDTIVAQTQTGSRSLGVLKGFWAQAGWNVLGLLACAVFAVRERAMARDPRLLRLSLGLAVAMIVTFLTNFKEGTGLNITVPVEAALVAPAACGAVFAARAARAGSTRARVPAIVCAVGVALTLAQSVSLIASPGHSVPFLRPFSALAWAILLDGSQVRSAVALARTCPAGVPYSGPPLLAFLAGRPMPAGQPDQFIITHSRELSALRARIAATPRICPIP